MTHRLPGALCRDCGAHMHSYFPDRCSTCQDQRRLDATDDPIDRQHLQRIMSGTRTHRNNRGQ